MEPIATDSIRESSHAWRRALDIAGSHFPDAYGPIFRLYASGASLDLYPNETGDGYYVACPSIPPGSPLNAVLAALAEDRKEYEIEDGRRLARLAFNDHTYAVDTYRSGTEGFGGTAFDEEYAALTEEHQRAAQKAQARSRRYNLPVKALRGWIARKLARREKVRQGDPPADPKRGKLGS